uniref:Phosphomevalonate kinase n=1 Tax=Henneguya salminicola TaxID=69463 RepID=A0A6G3MJ51_HENSL
MKSSLYKEQFRREMILFGENIRKLDPYYFCKIIDITAQQSGTKCWVIADCRRLFDIKYFSDKYPERTITVRIECPLYIRSNRGFEFECGIDDAESECGLDNYKSWHHVIKNADHFDPEFNNLVDKIKKLCFIN